jgi:hypothetical protein
MSSLRFSLLAMFVAVAVAAVGCAAMVKPSYVCASAVWTATMAVLAGSLVGCCCGTPRSRAFCAGFALFGWGHMILFFAPWFDDHTGDLLFTRHIVDYIGGKLGYKVASHITMPGIWHNLKWAEAGTSGSFVYLAYVVIGQSLLTIVIGLLGGVLGRYLHSRSQPAARGAS